MGDLQQQVKEYNAEIKSALETLWNNINKEEQDGFIRQAEALV